MRIFADGFWKAAAIRAIRTMAQTAIALIPTSAIILTDVNWLHIASGAVLSGIISLLTSLVTGLPEVEKKDGGEDA